MHSTKSVQEEARAMNESDVSNVCIWKGDMYVSRMSQGK